MAEPSSQELQCTSSKGMYLNTDEISKSNHEKLGKHDANDLVQVQDYVDFTEDKKCFVCSKKIEQVIYPLANTVTHRTKTHIAQKLGQFVDKNFIIVITENDYICKGCVYLFNRYDTLEYELECVGNIILQKLESTYKNKQKVTTLPNHVSKALQSLLNKQVEPESPPAKKSCIENESSNVNNNSDLKYVCLPLENDVVSENHDVEVNCNKSENKESTLQDQINESSTSDTFNQVVQVKIHTGSNLQFDYQNASTLEDSDNSLLYIDSDDTLPCSHSSDDSLLSDS